MRRMLASVGGVGLAVLLSQFPEYAQQYAQRLGGAVDELRVVTEKFDRDAAEAGIDRHQALARYQNSPDAFLADRGDSESRNFDRYETLSAALRRISGAGPLERLQNLPAYLDTDIGRRTLENYKPAVPVTPEGFLYAGAGLFLGYVIFSALAKVVMLAFRPRRPVYRRS